MPLHALMQYGNDKPLYREIVESARRLGLAGASVFSVQFSLGSEGVIHDAQSDYSAAGVPVIATEPTIATELRAAGRQVIEAAPPTSADVAMLGWRKIQLGETVLPEALEANYIRRSDAEIFAKTK